MIILGIFLWLITLAMDLITDHRLRLQKRPVNHLRGALLRLIGLVPVTILLPFEWIGVVWFGYWVIFEGLNNLMNGQLWDYIGETAWSDKLIRRHPLLGCVKYAGLAGSIVILLV